MKDVKCYACAYCKVCDEHTSNRCKENGYILFTTEQEKSLCDLMCGKENDYDD